jgi:rifampin ADP-ribosylating transferase
MAEVGACGKTPTAVHNRPATETHGGFMTDMTDAPERFVVHESGAYLHGTKADLRVGDLLVPGRPSNYERGRISNHVYMTKVLDGAVLAAEMALGQGRGHVYIVEPQGAVEDDPNVTDKKLPGNPTHSYRSREPVRIVGEITDWVGHSSEQLQAFSDALDDLRRKGLAIIYD